MQRHRRSPQPWAARLPERRLTMLVNSTPDDLDDLLKKWKDDIKKG
jgi:hypothetical protein